jgi:hypothetical protein
MAKELASRIASQLLNDEDATYDLADAADMARRKFGEQEFNRYLAKEFARYSFGSAHLAIVKLPWNCIYTTNYDKLIEQAATSTKATLRVS